MDRGKREHWLSSLLWGGVAAVGQYTMLFLTIIRRIHVRFAGTAPVFYVDPRGPISLSKDSALVGVYVLTLLYGLLVGLLVFRPPRPGRRAWIVAGVLAVALAILAALAEPWWGLIILADALVLYPLLKWATG